MTLEQFKSEVETFLARTEMNATEFGRQFASDPNFVFDLRGKGREPRESTREKVLSAMQAVKSDRAA